MLLDIENSQVKTRAFCWNCRQPESGCYCASVRAFDPQIEFVILIHKIEARRRIATGRMSHLLLKNSHLIEGSQFEDHPKVNQLIAREDATAVVLYPGPTALNLTHASTESLRLLTDPVAGGKRLIVFVIDGTWATARRTMRLSGNLARLPRVCFDPVRKSAFEVRKQPADHCVSTLEAIHHTIELLGESQGFNTAERQHDHLLEIFAMMVNRQKTFVPIRNEPEA